MQNDSIKTLLVDIFESLITSTPLNLDEFIECKLRLLAKAVGAEACGLVVRGGPEGAEKIWVRQHACSQEQVELFCAALHDHSVFASPLPHTPLESIQPHVCDNGNIIDAISLPTTYEQEVLFFLNATALKEKFLKEGSEIVAIAHYLISAYEKKNYMTDARIIRLLLRISQEGFDFSSQKNHTSFDSIIRKLIKLLGFERMTFLRVDSDDGLMYTMHSVSTHSTRPYETDFPTTELYDELRSNKRMIFQHIPEDLLGSPHEVAFTSHLPIRSAVLSPIFVHGKLEAVVACGRATAPMTITKTHIHYLDTLATIMSRFLEKCHVERLLTKAYEEINLLKSEHWAKVSQQKEKQVRKLIGDIPASEGKVIRRCIEDAQLVAPTDCTVLIEGETGSGKEIFARYIHDLSPRKNKNMTIVNCAAVPQQLFESEFFGTRKGAYTSATENRVGKFEMADGSTLFLDEIGELPLDAQAKLLRVIQEGEFERLGSTKTIQVNVRIIAATNRDLAQMVRDKLFRDDLYYRLCVYPIRVPPLRERQENIPELVWYFVREFGKRYGKPIHRISKTTMQSLLLYPWPGNIRELRNVIEQSVLRSRDGVLQVQQMNRAEPLLSSFALDDVEREHIARVLVLCGGKVSGKGGAAELLQMDRSTLAHRMNKHGLKASDFKSA